jgi:hypothetical protein
MCDSTSEMTADAFELKLAEDEGVTSCYYLAPVAHQSAVDLVHFFNECGSAQPAKITEEGAGAGDDDGRLRQTDVCQRETRSFELRMSTVLVAGPTPRCKKAEVFAVDEQAAENGATVMVYQVRCTALSSKQSKAPAPTWELSKLFDDFDTLRQELVRADKTSQADPLDIGLVPFPPQLPFWSRGEDASVAATRRLQLQTWINQMIFLNNTLVTSGHLELDTVMTQFLQRQTDAQRKSVAVEGAARRVAVVPEASAGGDAQPAEGVPPGRRTIR